MNNLIDLDRLKLNINSTSEDIGILKERLSDLIDSGDCRLLSEEEWKETYCDCRADTNVMPLTLEGQYVTTTITPDWATISTRQKTLAECIEDYMASYKPIPVTCVNCGGRIDKDTMTCCYCGTFYR